MVFSKVDRKDASAHFPDRRDDRPGHRASRIQLPVGPDPGFRTRSRGAICVRPVRGPSTAVRRRLRFPDGNAATARSSSAGTRERSRPVGTLSDRRDSRSSWDVTRMMYVLRGFLHCLKQEVWPFSSINSASSTMKTLPCRSWAADKPAPATQSEGRQRGCCVAWRPGFFCRRRNGRVPW